MKNCACNLLTRFHQINHLLIKLASNDPKLSSNKMETKRWQLEKVAHMLSVFSIARDCLQQAFGSAFLVIFIYNLFAVALSSYIMINANQRVLNNLYYITLKYFGFELPLILKDFYFTAYFHQIGNTVTMHI